MEEAQSRVEKATGKMMSTVDKERLRKLQADMFRCSMNCCEDQTSSLHEVQNCIDRCSGKVSKAQSLIQAEMQSLQDRLQRCVMSCQDKVRDKISSSTTEGDMTRYRGEVENCAVRCADDHVQLLPNLTKKILDSLDKNM